MVISFLGVRTDRHGFGILTWKHVGSQKISTQKLSIPICLPRGRGCIIKDTHPSMFPHVVQHEPVQPGWVVRQPREADGVAAGHSSSRETPRKLRFRLLALPFHLPELIVTVLYSLHQGINQRREGPVIHKKLNIQISIKKKNRRFVIMTKLTFRY